MEIIENETKEIVDLIKRDAVKIYSEDDLMELLQSGNKLKIKLGADPSRPDLHLGHSVILRKLKLFQELGHEVIFVIGDFTGMIGDPSGRSKTRPSLTLEETRKSGRSYYEQVCKILDPDKTTIVYNSEWLNKMNFADVIKLAGKYTLARIMERDDFENRYKDNQPIGLHEILYPLVQGYDSVALEADIEIGGTDQTFNLLVGRELQKDYGQKQQVVMTFPILTGLDGKEKMSKSLNNYIGLNDSAEVMFEKTMKIPDDNLLEYFALTTDFNIDTAKKLIADDIRNAHIEYGKLIVSMYHGDSAIDNTISRYNGIASGKLPDNMETVIISKNRTINDEIWICELLKLVGLATSNGDAKRSIEGKGIKVNGNVVTESRAQVNCNNSIVVSKGRNKFFRVVFE